MVRIDSTYRDISGMTLSVEKIMSAEAPRRVARLETRLALPEERASRLDADARRELEHAAHTCPVRISLAPSVDVPIEFVWSDPQQRTP